MRRLYFLLVVFFFFAQLSCLALRVTVKIIDEFSQPIKGVHVGVEGDEEISGDPKTLDDGKCVFVLNDKKYKIGYKPRFVVYFDGYQVNDPDMLSQGIPDPQFHIVIRMKKILKPVKIFGFVRDQNGVGIVDARVIIEEFDIHTNTLDDNGKFEMKIPYNRLNETVTVKASKADYSFGSARYSITTDPSVINLTVTKVEQSEPSNMYVKNENLTSQAPSLRTYLNTNGSPFFWFSQAQYYNKSITLKRKDGREIDNLNLSLTYRSTLNNANTGFGLGWQSNYESSIDLNNSTISNIIYHDESGKNITFIPAMDKDSFAITLTRKFPDLNGSMALIDISSKYPLLYKRIFENINSVTYIGNDISVLTLKLIPRGFAIRAGSSTEYTFGKDGKLEIIDEHGKLGVKVLYNITGKIAGISNQKQFLEFSYNRINRIDRFTYEDSTGYSFQYNPEGQLISISNNFNKKKKEFNFLYDRGQLLSEFMDWKEKEKVLIFYDYKKRRVKIQQKNSYTRWYFEIEDSLMTISRAVHQKYDRYWEQTDSITYNFNKKSQWLSRIDHGGQVEESFLLTPCACGSLMSVKKRIVWPRYEYTDSYINSFDAGDSSVFYMDTLSALEIDEKTTALTDSLKFYNENINLQSEQSSLDTTVKIVYDTIYNKYDDWGNILEMRDGDSKKVWHYHLEYLKVDTVKMFFNDSLNELVTYEYNSRADLVKVRDHINRKQITLTYDANFRIDSCLIHSNTKNGNVFERGCRITYNNKDKIVALEKINEGEVSFTYDQKGEMDEIVGDKDLAMGILSILRELVDLSEKAQRSSANRSYIDISSP